MVYVPGERGLTRLPQNTFTNKPAVLHIIFIFYIDFELQQLYSIYFHRLKSIRIRENVKTVRLDINQFNYQKKKDEKKKEVNILYAFRENEAMGKKMGEEKRSTSIDYCCAG